MGVARSGIHPAAEDDLPLVLSLIKSLALYGALPTRYTWGGGGQYHQRGFEE